MRRPVIDALLHWHRDFERTDLPRKLEKLAVSPFGFFRGTYFLFTASLPSRPFLRAAGPVIGDIHTQNYGSFRAITGRIVFDINDFDETTEGWYEFDVYRLAVSLILAAEQMGHRLGDGVNAAEAAVREWIASLARWRHTSRQRFEAVEPMAIESRLLAAAAVRSREKFIGSLAELSSRGCFVFKPGAEYIPVSAAIRQSAAGALPEFLRHCIAPAKAKPRRYTFQDACRRVAGNGSMGRPRFAVLLGKGVREEETLSSLRLVEWKWSLDSSLDRKRPYATAERAEQVFEATRRFQLHPKRYLGYTHMLGLGLQAREIGANDRRFSTADLAPIGRFEDAAALFGRTLARCHLLGSMGETGPREVPLQLHGNEEAFVHHVLRFAVASAAEVHAGHAELLRNRARVEEQWRPKDP